MTKHLNLGVLFVSLISAPQIYLHNQVSMESCTGERGKAKQNKIRTGEGKLETAHCHGLGERLLKTRSHWLTYKMEKWQLFFLLY